MDADDDSYGKGIEKIQAGELRFGPLDLGVFVVIDTVTCVDVDP